jgi:hypothetical protein
MPMFSKIAVKVMVYIMIFAMLSSVLLFTLDMLL